jgi:hypothetical protein
LSREATFFEIELIVLREGNGMRILACFSAVLFSLVLLYAPSGHADEAVSTMANIVVNLKHFPSDSDKAALAAIAESDSDDAVKAIAVAIANISHKATDADKATLAAIVADDSQDAAVRALAGVVGSLTHLPNADAIATLQGIANP